MLPFVLKPIKAIDKHGKMMSDPRCTTKQQYNVKTHCISNNPCFVKNKTTNTNHNK